MLILPGLILVLRLIFAAFGSSFGTCVGFRVSVLSLKETRFLKPSHDMHFVLADLFSIICRNQGIQDRIDLLLKQQRLSRKDVITVLQVLCFPPFFFKTSLVLGQFWFWLACRLVDVTAVSSR